MYWLPKLHKKAVKYLFISASSKCSTTYLSGLLTSPLTTIKERIINFCNEIYENSEINYFWRVKNSLDVLDKLRAFDGPFDSVNSFEFSTLYTSAQSYQIKVFLFKYICCNSFEALFSDEKGKYTRYTYWRCDEMIEVVNFLV